MKKATLIFLIDKNEQKICLAMKKRGFGVGMWNGYGGKVEDGETITQAAIRELGEESGDEDSQGIRADEQNLNQVATFKFIYPDNEGLEMQVEVFLLEEWLGEPTESEEMRPQWFHFDDIPYTLMWADDSIWLPRVLAGERLEGWFSFNDDGSVASYELTTIT